MANTTDFAVEKPTVGGYRNTWGGTLNTALETITELLALALPVGTIKMFPTATAPTQTTNGGTWLVCKGQTLVRTDYPELHTLITDTYGTYPSLTTFVLPDMQARVPVGYNAAGIDTGSVNLRSPRAIADTAGGTEGHILTTPELSAHSHAIPQDTHFHAIADHEETHAHVGSATGSKTSEASAVIVDPKHDHDMGTKVDNWNGGLSYATLWTGKGNLQTNPRTVSNSTGITDSGHAHTMDTNAVATGLTKTDPKVIGITATTAAGGTSGTASPHNNMPPFLVVNYIILAKHPTF